MPNLSQSETKVPENVLRMFAASCLKNSQYDLVQGSRAQSYFDFDEWLASDRHDLSSESEILNHLVEKIRRLDQAESLDALVFVERENGPVGLIAARIAIAERTKLPAVTVRPRKRISSFALKGKELKPGDKVAILTDVSSSGMSIVGAAERLWEVGARIAAAISMVDRGQGASEYLGHMDISLQPVTTLGELQAALST